MKVFASYYDEPTKKFMVKEVDETNIILHTDLKKARTVDTYKEFTDEQLAQAHADISNHDLEVGDLEIIKCKDCKKLFTIDKKEMNWYKERNYTMPIRCFSCRKKRKANKKGKATQK